MAENKINAPDEELIQEQDTETKKSKKTEDEGEELVTRFYFADGNKYKDDIYVSVNNTEMYIPRGKPIQIKRKFAEIADAKERQNIKAASYMSEMMVKTDTKPETF